jgi:hypothetical protein
MPLPVAVPAVAAWPIEPLLVIVTLPWLTKIAGPAAAPPPPPPPVIPTAGPPLPP